VRPRLACKNILSEIGECHVTARLVARGRISHKVTFDLVGKNVLNRQFASAVTVTESAVRICSDSSAMHRRQPSTALPLSTRAVTVPEPDVLVTHLAIRRAGDAQRARLGIHGLEDNGCSRALFASVIHRLPAGAARRYSAARTRPDRFSCLTSAAGCYCLFIDSSERTWGSRRHSAPQRPRLDPRRGYPALTVACLRCF